MGFLDARLPPTARRWDWEMTNGKCGWQYIANQGQCGCEAIYGEIVQTKHAAKTGQNLHVFMARADRSVSPRPQLLLFHHTCYVRSRGRRLFRQSCR